MTRRRCLSGAMPTGSARSASAGAWRSSAAGRAGRDPRGSTTCSPATTQIWSSRTSSATSPVPGGKTRVGVSPRGAPSGSHAAAIESALRLVCTVGEFRHPDHPREGAFMTPQALLKQQLGGVHDILEQTIADCSQHTLDHNPPNATITNVGSIYRTSSSARTASSRGCSRRRHRSSRPGLGLAAERRHAGESAVRSRVGSDGPDEPPAVP